ncbi:LysR family transcriptional regulator [Mesorhizobium sp. DCY119]|uniref:LysR family transcriptional regulator n=1 Tax=Mesorhizobium sp. DCY119 TaxID=2108445 RepID=UPI000E74A9E5|nr:LysR family transcriptional regulator [Mesorhizobium sp. DCY119]RJG40540.1 LysR family transcriptional regulator [Mesorhizobium sp. DCY119]
MDSLGSLNVFIRAAEARSFTVAGRQLGVSSSGVGKAIARLEARLGTRLFHRSTRSIALTTEGARFLERCQRILVEIEEAEQELSQSQGAPRGKLRVSLPLVGMLMMPMLTRFMRVYPEIELDLDFNDRLVDLIEEGFDAVVRTGDAVDSRLMTRVLGNFRHNLVASPAYLEKHGTPKTPAELERHACLHHKYPTTGKLASWHLRERATELDIELPKTATVSTIEPLIYMAEQGLGIACLPEYAIRQHLNDGKLVAVLSDHTQHVGTFRALWPSSRFVSPKIRVFVDFLAGNLLPDRSSRDPELA